MNSSVKKFLMLAAAVFALGALGAGSASAASQFTASATGSLTGHALTTQTFTTTGGTVKCTTAETTGTISSTASTEQHVTVTYKNCNAFGFVNTDITPATYLFTTHTEGTVLVNTVHILNSITITPTGAGCTQTVGPQTLGEMDFSNENASAIAARSTISGIIYSSTGGICGPSGNNGTYVGENTIERVGGGSVQFDS